MNELLLKFNDLDGIKRINKREFCRKIGVSADTLYNFLKGKNVTSDTLRRIDAGLKDIRGDFIPEKSVSENTIGGTEKMSLVVDVDAVLSSAKRVMLAEGPFSQLMYDAICLVNKAAGVAEDLQSRPQLHHREGTG